MRHARAILATALGLGISAGVAAMIMLQRWVAEGDDTELPRRRGGHPQ